MSFDVFGQVKRKNGISLNPFGTGQCLSTTENGWLQMVIRFNPFGTGQCLSTTVTKEDKQNDLFVSIPLEQGNVFRQVRILNYNE